MHSLRGIEILWLVVSLVVCSDAFIMSMRRFLARKDNIRNLMRLPKHQRSPRKVILRLNGSCDDNAATARTEEEQIKLNIGGQLFITTRATLTRFQDTIFSDMFASTSASSKCPLGACDDGICCHQPVGAFFDRDGTHFRLILNFLQYPDSFTMVGLDQHTQVEVLKEFEFYGLRKLLLSQLTFHSIQHIDEIESLIQHLDELDTIDNNPSSIDSDRNHDQDQNPSLKDPLLDPTTTIPEFVNYLWNYKQQHTMNMSSILTPFSSSSTGNATTDRWNVNDLQPVRVCPNCGVVHQIWL